MTQAKASCLSRLLLPVPLEPSVAAGRVFTHFLQGLQNSFGRNSLGKNTSWDECVAAFDVEAYAADAAATGAKYAFITIMQDSQFMIAPNAVFDTLTGYKPAEACATRDLVLDLWAALNKRGLKLGLYFTGDGACSGRLNATPFSAARTTTASVPPPPPPPLGVAVAPKAACLTMAPAGTGVIADPLPRPSGRENIAREVYCTERLASLAPLAPFMRPPHGVK